jgi:flagellar biosynthetic protein FlhB
MRDCAPSIERRHRTPLDTTAHRRNQTPDDPPLDAKRHRRNQTPDDPRFDAKRHRRNQTPRAESSRARLIDAGRFRGNVLSIHMREYVAPSIRQRARSHDRAGASRGHTRARRDRFDSHDRSRRHDRRTLPSASDMASDRSFPPSARRLALARAAGLTPASPLLVGALAAVGAVLALAAVGGAIAARIGAWVRAAIESADGSRVGSALEASVGSATEASVGSATDIVHATVALALPVLGSIAIVAMIAHLAQTRALWIPRRRVDNAPAEDPQRATRGVLGLANATVIAIVAVVWLFAMAPRIAALVSVGSDGATALGASVDAQRVDGGTIEGAALLVLSFLATLAIAWVVLGAIDALVRFAGHVHSLRMTPEEQRADQRLAGADPRWRARREKLARGEPARDAVAGASVLVLGDGVAVAVAWDPVRRPIPTRTASGRAARATQLLGLARRHSIAVHRDAELATLLATGDGPVPEVHWPRLAEIVAATRRAT